MKIDKNGLNWMEMAKMAKMAKIGKMAKMAKNSKTWQKMLVKTSNLPKTTETIGKKQSMGKIAKNGTK